MAAIFISTDKGATKKNIYTAYKALPCRGFYEALLTPSAVKQPITNSSRLEHGTRVITSKNTTMLKANSFTLEFFIEGSTVNEYLTRLDSFLTDMRSGEIWLFVEQFNRIYKLVYSECSKYGDYGSKKGKFALKFTEYNPNNRASIT